MLLSHARTFYFRVSAESVAFTPKTTLSQGVGRVTRKIGRVTFVTFAPRRDGGW